VYLIIVSLPSHFPLKFLSMNTIRPKNTQSFGLTEHWTAVLHEVGGVFVFVVGAFDGQTTAEY